MNIEHEHGTRLRVLKVLIALITHPHGYTKKQLAKQIGVAEKTISRIIDDFRSAGFIVNQDEQYRYTFAINNSYKQLKDLLHFSEEDQILLYRAIDQIDPHGKRGQLLKKKLRSLYDFRQLGHAYLKTNYLSKVDVLLQSREAKKSVILKQYRSSNSDTVRDRFIEVIHVEPARDLVYGFELEQKKVLHFRLTRFTRVEKTEQPWQYESKHRVETSDPFRIVNDNQVPVHLRLKVGGYNNILEQFPLTAAYLQPSAEPDVYDFEAKVNRKFLGITNFIMGNYHQVIEIVYPQELVEHIQREAAGFAKRLGEE